MIDVKHSSSATHGSASDHVAGISPGKQSHTDTLAQMKPAVQLDAAPAAGPAGAAGPAAAEGAAGDGLVDQMVAAMGFPPLPKTEKSRKSALTRLGMTPETARQQAAAMFAQPAAAAAEAAPADGGGGGEAPAQGKLVQPKADATVRDVDISNSGGTPINPEIAGAMGSALGGDLSGVMLHQDGQAEAIGAHAFTSGNHVHFAQGKLDTSSQSGLALLGHELTHVVQQSAGRVSVPTQSKSEGGNAVNVQDFALEKEADDLGAVAASAVSGAIYGKSPFGGGAGTDAAQMKPAGDLATVGGMATVQAKPLVQCEPVTLATTVLFTIAGSAVTLGEAAAIASTVVAAGTFVAQQTAASTAVNNTTGPALRLPSDQGATFASSETGKDMIAAFIRVKSAKALKVVAEQAAAKTSGDAAAKEAAAQTAVDSGKDNATANAGTQVKNSMQARATGGGTQTFTWNDQNGEGASPTYGQVTVTARTGYTAGVFEGIGAADWTDYNITAPSGSMCHYFRSVVMSANCNDSTVEWWDKLEVTPTQLQFIDAGEGAVKAVGEAVFQWPDSRTKLVWTEANPVVHQTGVLFSPTHEGVPND